MRRREVNCSEFTSICQRSPLHFRCSQPNTQSLLGQIRPPTDTNRPRDIRHRYISNRTTGLTRALMNVRHRQRRKPAQIRRNTMALKVFGLASVVLPMAIMVSRNKRNTLNPTISSPRHTLLTALLSTMARNSLRHPRLTCRIFGAATVLAAVALIAYGVLSHPILLPPLEECHSATALLKL